MEPELTPISKNIDRIKVFFLYLGAALALSIAGAFQAYVVKKLGGEAQPLPPLPAPLQKPDAEIRPLAELPPATCAAGEWKIPPGEMVPQALEMVDIKAAEKVCWGITAAKVQDVWAAGHTGKGVVVAVIDTGCDLSHPDVQGAVIDARDFTGSQYGPDDRQGHGTHVAGIVGARKNGVGVVGWAPDCSLMILKALGDTGSGQEEWIVKAIDYAVSKKADVVSMSLGSRAPSDAIHAAVKRARAAGLIVVCAAGNDGPAADTVNYPAKWAEAVCVAAVNDKVAVANFSSRGPEVLVAAPGADVVSDFPGSKLATMSGTSMATPCVSGIAALWVSSRRAKNLPASHAAFAEALAASAKDIGAAGRDKESGFGFVQPAAMILKGDPAVPPPPHPPKDVIQIDAGNKIVTVPPGWAVNPPVPGKK